MVHRTRPPALALTELEPHPHTFTGFLLQWQRTTHAGFRGIAHNLIYANVWPPGLAPLQQMGRAGAHLACQLEHHDAIWVGFVHLFRARCPDLRSSI